MTNFVRLSALTALMVAITITVSGCHTVAGAGQDVSSVGHGVTNGAVSTQNSIEHSR